MPPDENPFADTIESGLTPQEQNLYQHHLDNLYGTGKVRNPGGSISTVLQAVVPGPGGRYYNIPTVWDGQELDVHTAQQLAAQRGWANWPSYPTPEAADLRYDVMHDLLDRDTERYQQATDPTGSISNKYAIGGQIGFQEGGETPPPFDPSNPFAQWATPAAPDKGSNPFAQWAPKEEMPQWTKEKPFQFEPGKTPAAQLEGLPGGSYVQFPGEGEPRQKAVPKPPPPEAAVSPDTQEPYDLSAFPKPPPPPGLVGTAIEAGRRGIVESATAAAHAPTAFQDRPAEAPDTSPVGKLLTQPVTEGWSDPKWWIAHIAHGVAGASPALALGAAGTIAGGGPESPIGIAGGIGGFALGSMMTEIAPAYQKARQDGLSHDDAVTRSLEETGIAGAVGAAMGATPLASIFGRDAVGALKRPVSEALSQIFGVQPAVSAAGQVATGAVEGKMPTASELATGYAENVGVGAGMVGGHAAARAFIPGRETPVPTQETPPSATPGEAPAGAPTVGETVHVAGYTGPLTVDSITADGLVRLKDEDGTLHTMPIADIEKYKQEAPVPTPEAPTPPEPAPAAQAPATQPLPSDNAFDLFQAGEQIQQAEAQKPSEPITLAPSQEDHAAADQRNKLAAMSGAPAPQEESPAAPPLRPDTLTMAPEQAGAEAPAVAMPEETPPARAQPLGAETIRAEPAMSNREQPSGVAPPVAEPAPPRGARPAPPSADLPAQEISVPARPIRQDQAVTATGRTIPVEYAIIDAHDAITSHHDDLRENAAYPQELQPRDRTRVATADQITDILRQERFRPELVGETPDASNGAPIIGPDGFVNSGNMRIMAIRRAYDQGSPAAETYRDFLQRQGYPIEGVASPMLVRIDRSGMDMAERAKFNVEANVSAQAAMSPTERAQADARRLSSGILNLATSGDLTTAGNRRFIRAALDQISTAGERAGLMDREGNLNQIGQKRLEAALLARAYDDPILVASLTEDPEPNIKRIGNALLDASPEWARMRAAIAEQRVPAEVDLTPQLAEAAKLVSQARAEHQKLVDFVNQRDMFGGGIDPLTEAILREWMFEGPQMTRDVGRAKIADALDAYAKMAQHAPSFLDVAPRSVIENINAAREKARGANSDLFPEPNRPTAVGQSAGQERIEAQRPGNGETGLGLSEGRTPTGWESVGNATEVQVLPARDTTAEAQQLHERGNYPAGSIGAHIAARDYVSEQGRRSGDEYAATATDEGRIGYAGTSGYKDAVMFPPEFVNQLWNPNAIPIAIHHNHPTDKPLSLPDLMVLAAPGTASISAHGHDGRVSSASLTPEARASLSGSPREQQQQIAQAGAYMETLAEKVVDPVFKRGMLPARRAEELIQETRNRLLAAQGIIDYVSTRELPGWVTKKIMADLAGPNAEEVGDRFYRSTGALRPEEAMARISDTHAELAAGRSTGAGSYAPSGKRTEQAAPVGIGTQGLRETGPPDLSDRATNEAVENAGSPTDKEFLDRIQSKLGAAEKSPGFKEYWFNIANKNFTFPRTLAALDSRWNAKWVPEMAKKRLASEYLDQYKNGFASWQGQPKELWNKVLSAMEVLTLQGREVPLDGRAVIAENTAHPLAALSKMDDTLRLETPQEIKMFTDARKTMDQVWQNLVTEAGRQLGWEGAPGAAEIKKGIESATSDRERRQLERAARIVSAIEYQRRASYLPLMRSGDYFLRVTPKEGTPDKPGILGWTGDGFPPTVNFSLIDSHSWLDRAIGGQREGGAPKRAQAAIEELQKQFPAEEYNIDHGYMFRDQDTIKNLNIPAVEKLMMLVGNDVRDQLSRHVGEDDAHKAYEGIIDGVLDQVAKELTPTARENIIEQRIAGFRQQRGGIPGYDPDFAKSIGRYVHWLSSYTAGLRYRQEIDAANEGLTQHPDPRVQSFARDWDRRHEDSSDQLNGPLMQLRQANFYWLLGMNAATTTKIMLHGPLLGVPTLTTGLGASGRMAAAGSYLNAAQQLMRGIRIGKDGIELSDMARGITDPRERAMMEDFEQRGLTHPAGADELRAVQNKGEEALTERQRFARRVMDIWASNVSTADRLIRGAMARAAYRTATREGMDAIDKVWGRDLNWANQPEKTPEKFAEFMVDRTAGIWGDMNRLPIIRSQLGGLIGQYRSYELNYLSTLHQMMWRMGPEGKVTAGLMLGGLGSLAGAAAIPFVEDAEKAAETVYGWISGLQPNLQADLRHAVDGLGLWQDAGNDFLHGPRPFGVDLGQGIGFGDILSRNAKSPLDLAGAAISSFSGGAYRAWQKWSSGQGEMAAARELMPNAVKHMVDGLYPEAGLTSASGATKIDRPENMSDADRVKVGLGFQLASRNQRYEERQESINAQQANRQALAKAENRLLNLRERGVDTSDALTDVTKLVAQGVKMGIYKNFQEEMKRVNYDLKNKIGQRLRPEIGSRTMQRMEHARQVQP